VANISSVRHSRQLEDGYCLPVCAQMALAYLGISRSQKEIGRVLKLRRGFGAPASQIVNLSSRRTEVLYQVGGAINDILDWLRRDVPVIAFVQAGELPHWRGVLAQHAVLVVALDEQHINIHDPAMDHGPIEIPLDDFLLAWDEMDSRYAVIAQRTAD
jgi:hypothetical protein